MTERAALRDWKEITLILESTLLKFTATLNVGCLDYLAFKILEINAGANQP